MSRPDFPDHPDRCGDHYDRIMTAELDHVFIYCAEGAPEAELLVEQGLLEGSGNTHPGQGTANRRFFFANAYLELLWVSDAAEAQSEAVMATQFWERWSRRRSGACPFGIVYRPRAGAIAAAPFHSWSYRPSYLPSGLAIEVGRGLALSEPQLFYLPFVRPPDSVQPQPTAHPASIDAIAGVSVTLPTGREPTESLQRALDLGLLTVTGGPAYHLDLSFTGEGSGLDFRPALPLSFTPCQRVVRAVAPTI
jgi:hypothetical protein